MNPENPTCLFCNYPEDDYGGLKITNGTTAHYYCVLLSDTITQSGRDHQGILGFLEEEILEEHQRSKYKRCFYCGELGANLMCAQKKCSHKFHLPCGRDKNAHFNFKNHTAYCHFHRKKFNISPRIKKNITNYQCVICMDKLTKQDYKEIIWATCCKAIVLHRNCIQQFAVSAGYYTKCPGCNNGTKFIDNLRYYGVFVPEQDASWELGNNFIDLYNQHKTCDAVICKNPNGRNNFTPRGKWKLHLCNCCGSNGTHQNCSLVKREFVCPDCTLNQTGSDHTSFLPNSPPFKLDANHDSEKSARAAFELGESSRQNENYCNKNTDLIEGTVLDEAVDGEHDTILNIEEIDVTETFPSDLTDADKFKNELTRSILGEEMNEACVEAVCLEKVVPYAECHKVFKSSPALNSENSPIKQIECDKPAMPEKSSRLNGIITALRGKLMNFYHSFSSPQE